MGRMLAVLILCVQLAVVSNASAQQTEMESDWAFNLAPFYLWAINIEGDQTIGPATGSVDVDFSDIFDNLDSAFIVHFEGMHKNRYGFLIDVNYLDLSEKSSLPTGITRKIDLDLSLAEFAGLYRWVQDEHSFDLIFGVRYAEIENDISIVGGGSLADGSQDWLDPIVGGRWIYNFADDWSLVARGDIGGFGVGSDFAWQALGIVEWQPFKYASFLAGYRALGLDYEDGSISDQNYFHFDATIHGPVIGLNFKW